MVTLAWFRVNLALLMAASGVLATAVGFLISATVRITTMQAATDEQARQLGQLHLDMVSVDARFHDQQRAEQAAQAEQDKRLALLEQQLKWAIDRVPSSLSRPR